MSNWPVKKLGEVAEFLDNLRKPITASQRIPGPYPYYGANGQVGWINNYIFDEELVLLAEDGGNFGSKTKPIAYKISGKTWVNNHAHVLRPKKDIVDIDWLYFNLMFADVSKFIKGATRAKLNQTDARQIEIPVPPISEQGRIVKKLEKILAKIDQVHSLRQESLLELRSIIFSTINKLFLESQKKGLRKLKIGDMSRVTSSKRVYEHEYVSQGVPFFRTKEISELANNKQIKTELFISKERFSELKNKFGSPKRDDVLVTAIGTIGEIYIVDNDLDFYFKDGNVLWLKELKSINPKFLKLCLQFVIEKLKDASVGSAYKALSIEKLKQVEIPSPDLKEQEKIVAYLDGLSEKVQVLQKLQQEQLQDLEALQQSVLHQAFQGKL